jgi:hypothetical protein
MCSLKVSSTGAATSQKVDQMRILKTLFTIQCGLDTTIQKVANRSALREGGHVGVEMDGSRILLAMVESIVYAMNAVSAHKRCIFRGRNSFGIRP